MTVTHDLNNQPVPTGWKFTGVDEAVNNPRARWMKPEGKARLTFELTEAQTVNVFVVVAYPYRLQSLTVKLNGQPLVAGQTAEAWYKQTLTGIGKGKPGLNTVELIAAGPTGHPEGYMRLNQVKVTLGASPALPSRIIGPIVTSGVLLPILAAVVLMQRRLKT